MIKFDVASDKPCVHLWVQDQAGASTPVIVVVGSKPSGPQKQLLRSWFGWHPNQSGRPQFTTGDFAFLLGVAIYGQPTDAQDELIMSVLVKELFPIPGYKQVTFERNLDRRFHCNSAEKPTQYSDAFFWTTSKSESDMTLYWKRVTEDPVFEPNKDACLTWLRPNEAIEGDDPMTKHVICELIVIFKRTPKVKAHLLSNCPALAKSGADDTRVAAALLQQDKFEVLRICVDAMRDVSEAPGDSSGKARTATDLRMVLCVALPAVARGDFSEVFNPVLPDEPEAMPVDVYNPIDLEPFMAAQAVKAKDAKMALYSEGDGPEAVYHFDLRPPELGVSNKKRDDWALKDVERRKGVSSTNYLKKNGISSDAPNGAQWARAVAKMTTASHQRHIYAMQSADPDEAEKAVVRHLLTNENTKKMVHVFKSTSKGEDVNDQVFWIEMQSFLNLYEEVIAHAAQKTGH